MAERNSSPARGPVEAASLERVPPHSVEAEMSCLGSMLLDRHAAGEALLIVQPGDFYLPAHQQIVTALMELYDQNVAIDLVTMLEALKQRGWLEDAGGADYLARLAESVPSAANVEHYARIVKNKAILRNFITTTGELIRDAFDQDQPVEDFLDRAERRIFEVTERRVGGQAESLKDVLKTTFEEIEQASGGARVGVPTGFYELDDILTGLRKGEMIVLAARPSVGKTALAMNIAVNCATAEKTPVALFTLEMRKSELAKRLLAARAQIDMHDIGKGALTEEAYGKLIKAAGELAETLFFIDDTPSQTIFDIRTKCRRLKAQHDIQLVLIDYLQLLQHRRAENRQVEVSEISRAIKSLARELEIPVVAISQLNREVERHDREPRLSDIRESGAIEQDADVVLLLHRNVQEDPNVATLTVAKNRNGRVGRVQLVFQSAFVRFVPAAMHYATP